MDDRKWDILIAARLYAIAAFIALPVVHVSLQLGYVQPGGVVILGFAAWLVMKFVLFEPRTASRRFLILSLFFLVPATCLIFANFVIGLFINMTEKTAGGATPNLYIVICTIVYFPVMIFTRPLRGLNARAARLKSGGSFIKRNALEVLLALWILASVLILTVPYRTYTQAPPDKSETAGPVRLGFWTGKRFFDEEDAGPGRYVTDEMLTKFGENGVYLVYSGVRVKDGVIDESIVENLIRCRKYGVEVNISFSPIVENFSYINIWTFESIMGQIEMVLEVLDERGLLGDPVTTLVYDMEAPQGKFFPHYGRDPAVTAKLRDYYRVREVFREFNRRMMEKYGIRVRLCAETNQGFDSGDGDDDVTALYGVLSDPGALMSYMIYRRTDFTENYVVDSARYLREGDTIILNAWKEEGYQCRDDVGCAIKDARIVAGFPGKNYGVEVWALCYFMDAYGKDGLFEFVDAVTGDRSAWPPPEVRNRWPRAVLWDLAITAISALDVYAPLFRLVFHAY
ncbi:hypothetical protein ACFLQK_02375 [bacterium]